LSQASPDKPGRRRKWRERDFAGSRRLGVLVASSSTNGGPSRESSGWDAQGSTGQPGACDPEEATLRRRAMMGVLQHMSCIGRTSGKNGPQLDHAGLASDGLGTRDKTQADIRLRKASTGHDGKPPRQGLRGPGTSEASRVTVGPTRKACIETSRGGDRK